MTNETNIIPLPYKNSEINARLLRISEDLALTALADLDDALKAGRRVNPHQDKVFAFNVTFDSYDKLADDDVVVRPVIFNDEGTARVEELVTYVDRGLPLIEQRQELANKIGLAIIRLKSRLLELVDDFDDAVTSQVFDDEDFLRVKTRRSSQNIHDLKLHSYTMRVPPELEGRMDILIDSFFNGGLRPTKINAPEHKHHEATIIYFFNVVRGKYLALNLKRSMRTLNIEGYLSDFEN